jgi:hypothetical protein
MSIHEAHFYALIIAIQFVINLRFSDSLNADSQRWANHN